MGGLQVHFYLHEIFMQNSVQIRCKVLYFYCALHTSFLKGIKKDITSVENACTLPYNNGLAEGSINKLKTNKRVMYGRNSFELLRNKLLFLEARKFN